MLLNLFNKIKKTKLGEILTTPKELLLACLVGILVVVVIVISSPGARQGQSGHDHANNGQAAEKATIWTCSMHPQIKLPKPGKCPICFMDLIPLSVDSGGELLDTEIKLSETARKLARINTIKARKDFVSREIILSGRIEIDKTKEGKVAARFSGRIEKMYINYAGVEIKKGEHLYKIYSPEIYQVQESLITSLKNLRNAKKNNNSSLLRAAKASFAAAKGRLRLYGFTSRQIETIKNSGKAHETIDVYSPYSGTVIMKNKKEGDYVKEGTVIYNISDLTKVWVTFDAYEKDIRWLKYGEKVEIEFEAYAGKKYQARIAYIDPVLNEKTRTVRVRINLDNKDLSFKPGMFAEAKIISVLTDKGKFIDNTLVNKYICSMHPEIIKDKPGNCDVCKMALVKASELGYTSSAKGKSMKILIPATAPLFTGTRSIVYIEYIRDGEFVYEGREVVLGPKSGDFYVVEKGIRENESVVVSGVFKIDSAMQIVAKKSMMNLEPVESAPIHKMKKIHIENIGVITDLYIKGTQALAIDDFEQAKKHFINYRENLKQLKQKEITFQVKNTLKALEHVHHASDIKTLRNMLKNITASSIEIFKNVHNLSKDINIFHCPMADNNKGAFWLDTRKEVNNPYYGEAMLKCGENRGGLKIAGHHVKKN